MWSLKKDRSCGFWYWKRMRSSVIVKWMFEGWNGQSQEILISPQIVIKTVINRTSPHCSCDSSLLSGQSCTLSQRLILRIQVPSPQVNMWSWHVSIDVGTCISGSVGLVVTASCSQAKPLTLREAQGMSCQLGWKRILCRLITEQSSMSPPSGSPGCLHIEQLPYFFSNFQLYFSL